MRVPLPPWRPDGASLDSPYLAGMRNALWGVGGWTSQRALAPVIDATLAAPIQGMWTTRRSDGSLELFAGANGQILRLASKGGAATNIGGGYSASPAYRWRTVQVGSQLLATNYANPIQSYDLAVGGSYANLGGSPPKARYIAVVRDLVSVAYTSDGVDGEDAYRVRWHGYTSGLPDTTAWALGNPTTQADFQRLPDAGQITGLTGGEFGTVVCEGGVFRYAYVGSPVIYQFDAVERRLGCRVPESVVQYRQMTFFWSPSGFMAFDGSQVRPVGLGKVDDWFAGDLDEGAASLMWATVDLARQHVMWLYPGKGHDGLGCNRLIRYSPPLDEWMVADVPAQLVGPGRTFALDLDDPAQFPDLDAMDLDLDDPALWFSLPQTLAIAGGRVSSFGGATLEGSFELAERSFDGATGRRGLLNRAMIISEGGSPSLSVGRRERWGADMAWSRPYAAAPDGWIRMREPGRSHKLRVALTGDWRKAVALDLFGAPLGER